MVRSSDELSSPPPNLTSAGDTEHRLALRHPLRRRRKSVQFQPLLEREPVPRHFVEPISMRHATFFCYAQPAGSQASSAVKPRAPSAAQQSSAPEATGKRPPKLNRGKPVASGLAGDQAHSYRVNLDTGEYLRVRVEQRGVDVALKITGPDGRQILEVNSQAGAQGTEAASLVAGRWKRMRLPGATRPGFRSCAWLPRGTKAA